MTKNTGGVVSHWLFLFVGMLVSGVFRAFVLMSLWNWFVTVAFHVSDISFWNVYGISLVIGMFTTDSSKYLHNEQKWDRMMTILNYCVPEGVKPEMMETLNEEFGENSELRLLGLTIGGDFFGCAVVLGMGFVVHVLAG